MGRIIYLNGAPIGWNSTAMNSVTLSLTEVEYVSMSKGLKDLKFIYMCLKYLKMKVNLPMFVLNDNIGAIEMLDLKTGKCRTKHINTSISKLTFIFRYFRHMYIKFKSFNPWTLTRILLLLMIGLCCSLPSNSSQWVLHSDR